MSEVKTDKLSPRTDNGTLTVGDSGDTLTVTSGVTFNAAVTGSGAAITALNATNLASGTVPTARLGSGTASATTILKGNQTWATFYETGTWTPVFAGSGTAGAFTYTAQVGHYTKVANVITAQFRVAISAIGTAAAGYLYIQGLPENAYEYPGIVFSAIRNFTSGDVPSGGYIQSSTNYMQLMRYDASDPRNGWNTHCGGTALTTTSEIHGIVTYRTSAT